MRTVTVYGRPGCHLCDDALAVVERVRLRQPFALEVVDIESDEALLRAYLERIPVVAVDGEERFEFFVDEAALSGAVANLSPPPADPTPPS
jgi:glutaredoxin